jgi:ketosteroid isomerase-like protein
VASSGAKTRQDEILNILDRNLQAIWDGDAAAFEAICAPDVSFFEWYISTQHNETRVYHRFAAGWKLVHCHKSPCWRAPHDPPLG